MGRTHVIHTRTYAVNHLSRKKRQTRDMDRRCPEENKLSGEAGGLPGGGRHERDLANADPKMQLCAQGNEFYPQ